MRQLTTTLISLLAVLISGCSGELIAPEFSSPENFVVAHGQAVSSEPAGSDGLLYPITPVAFFIKAEPVGGGMRPIL